jgi:hypothetical protein
LNLRPSGYEPEYLRFKPLKSLKLVFSCASGVPSRD